MQQQQHTQSLACHLAAKFPVDTRFFYFVLVCHLGLLRTQSSNKEINSSIIIQDGSVTVCRSRPFSWYFCAVMWRSHRFYCLFGPRSHLGPTGPWHTMAEVLKCMCMCFHLKHVSKGKRLIEFHETILYCEHSVMTGEILFCKLCVLVEMFKFWLDTKDIGKVRFRTLPCNEVMHK